MNPVMNVKGTGNRKNRKKGSGGLGYALGRLRQYGRDAVLRMAQSVATGEGTRQLGGNTTSAFIATNAYHF